MIALSLMLLAVGLAMDAFAASVAQGASSGSRAAAALRIGAAFGAAQAIMPLIGWGLGLAFAPVVRAADHWVALVLLGFIGIRMVREGLSRDDDAPARQLIGWALLATAIATSIDAAAAGVALPMLGIPIIIACAVIGVTTAILSFGGVYLGAVAGARLGKAAEVAGGLVLIGLGLKIFIEHQFFG